MLLAFYFLYSLATQPPDLLTYPPFPTSLELKNVIIGDQKGKNALYSCLITETLQTDYLQGNGSSPLSEAASLYKNVKKYSGAPI